MLLEICTNSYQSAKIAAEYGADRIELCQSLESGGLTPSAGDIRMAVELKQRYNMEVYVLIRPRNGDFCYNAAEYEVMRADILYCKDAGVDGVVIGGLTAKGSIDIAGMEDLVATAAGMGLTFHRAFDISLVADEALKQISALGFHRLLTSGHARTAMTGKDSIKRLIERAGDDLVIMPGSGINSGNIEKLVAYTGAKEIHLSAKETIRESFAPEQDLFGLEYWQTNGAEVQRVKAWMNAIG